MKNYSALTPFLTAATFALVANTAVADPIRIQADFTCPIVSMVANFGDYIAGLGMEDVLSVHNPVYFKTAYYPIGVPANLNNYSNASTAYNSVTSTVTCSYASSNASEQPFDLSYFVSNGLGGRIRAQTESTIYIIFPVGFH